MKKRLVFVGALTVLVAFVVLFFAIGNIDTSFAAQVALRYRYADKKIDAVITDEDDINILKENLKGMSFSDSPSCGFSLDISLTFTDGEKSIVICPACDGCDIARVSDTEKYISIKDRGALESVLKKYGMEFPCF